MRTVISFLGAILVICLITGGFVLAIYLGLRGLNAFSCSDLIEYPNGQMVCEVNLN